MCRWQGKYDYTLSNGLVADQKRYREGVEEGGEKWVVEVNNDEC